MAGRRTNLALLVLLPVAFFSGWLSFALGTASGRWAVLAHGIFGLAVVVVAPWKSIVARRGLRRRGSGRAPGVVLAALVATSLVLGIAHSAGMRTIGPVSAMQVHVGAALVALPFAVYHFLVRRVRVHRTDFARRQLLRAGGLVGGSAVLYGAIEVATRVFSLPGEARRFTGSLETGSFVPDSMPVTQWLDDFIPYVDADTWRLVVRAGDEERRWSYAELDAFGDELRAVIDCTGGWYATQDWTGVRLDRLLWDVSGRSIVVRSISGYARTLPMADAGSLLVATRVGGTPLSPGHGFPARLVVPGRRGFWWVKWISGIEITDRPWWLQPPFPLT